VPGVTRSSIPGDPGALYSAISDSCRPTQVWSTSSVKSAQTGGLEGNHYERGGHGSSKGVTKYGDLLFGNSGLTSARAVAARGAVHVAEQMTRYDGSNATLPDTLRGWQMGTDEGHKSRRAMWIFGYGSLMFDGWEAACGCTGRRWADLPGYRRSFNKKSVESRGTPEAPGLTLNLVRAAGHVCRGYCICLRG